MPSVGEPGAATPVVASIVNLLVVVVPPPIVIPPLVRRIYSLEAEDAVNTCVFAL